MKKLEDFQINNKNIIVRVDFNVPIINGSIANYSRIETIIPTIKRLTKSKNKVFILTHLGRPNGNIVNELSLKFLCRELQLKLGISKVHFIESINNQEINNKKYEMNEGEVCLLENVRFYNQEEKNDVEFSKQLSSHFDYYINDAFSVSHRAHASIVGLPKFLPSLAGLSFIKEIVNLENFLSVSKKPNLAIIGGSKISTKIKVILNLINLFDSIVIGGAMANTFLLAKKINIGNSIYEENFLDVAENILINAKKKNCKIILPIDAVCSNDLKDNPKIIKCNIDNVPNNKMIFDIGENSINLISQEIKRSNSVLWNGPLGAFEYKPFDKSSIEIANLIKKSFNQNNLKSLAGGGDTLSVIKLATAKDGFNYLSNAGGAFLEWLEGNKSPGYIALENNKL